MVTTICFPRQEWDEELCVMLKKTTPPKKTSKQNKKTPNLKNQQIQARNILRLWFQVYQSCVWVDSVALCGTVP